MHKALSGWGNLTCALALGAVLAVTPFTSRAQDKAPAFQPSPEQAALLQRARALGVTDSTSRSAPGGGMILGGKLEGRQFAVAIPAGWKGDALVFAHGYTLPGTPVDVAEDPLSAGAGGSGIMRFAYQDGLAAGLSAYDKAGMGVKTGATNTLRLRNFLASLGAKKIYVSGSSMGGNIVMALIEQQPRAFAGALAQCGVTDGWEREIGQLTDLRLAYNQLTAGTPYALPGVQDATRSALPIVAAPGQDQDAFMRAQVMTLVAPVVALFMAAEKAPDGPEARIIRQTASIGGFEPDKAAFFYPLVTLGFGADDMRATFGGQIYGNRDKVYRSNEMTPAELEAFNRKVQRFGADPEAVAEARRWRQATGRFQTPLVTIHNRIDSLVPYAQAEGLSRIVAAAGNTAKLLQMAVPAVQSPLPLGGKGYDHCGFTADQIQTGWRALRQWTETGERPRLADY